MEFNSANVEVECVNCEVLVKLVPIRVIMTGDIKFYSTSLGMEDHERYWCWLCDLSKKQWEVLGHTKGSQQTLLSIIAVA